MRCWPSLARGSNERYRYPESNVLLMKEHGILTMASSISLAYCIADLIENTAKIAFIAASIPADD